MRKSCDYDLLTGVTSWHRGARYCHALCVPVTLPAATSSPRAEAAEQGAVDGAARGKV